jgi:hypothetical protein
MKSFILIEWSRGVSIFIDADVNYLALCLKRKLSQLTWWIVQVENVIPSRKYFEILKDEKTKRLSFVCVCVYVYGWRIILLSTQDITHTVF